MLNDSLPRPSPFDLPAAAKESCDERGDAEMAADRSGDDPIPFGTAFDCIFYNSTILRLRGACCVGMIWAWPIRRNIRSRSINCEA